jgi:DNA-binding response OmpR family regulator
LILTPLESILKKMDESALKSQLNGIHRNANNLLNLVNQLLDFRKLETSGETLKLSYCEVNEFVEAVLQPFFELAKEQQIDLNFDGNTAEIYAYVDKDKLHKILNNLLSNAFKFTPKGGSIKLKLSHSSEGKVIQIELSDTGYGIPEADLPFVFDRFYQAKTQDTANPGSGIGLHLVKEYVSLHGGTVNAASSAEQGSIFTVTIPSNLGPVGQKETIPEIVEKKNKLSLLIVEDNLEFRSFLVDELSEKYNLIVASNGREGLEKAHTQQPDLIITDLMMPEMSGIELCRHLKKDLEVSHIPVIVLTAKTSDQSQIEGFEAGADAYITKPFNMDILLVRIANLLEQQEQRKASFRKTVEITPETLATNTVDQELIKKVLAHIERNLDNPAYSVEQLSKDMFMDRTGLYRKLVAIVGQTPTEFMRSVRMKKAAQLLERGHSVSEVAEQVGFSGTSSYFSKCFQEEFGVKPSQYKKQPQTK